MEIVPLILLISTGIISGAMSVLIFYYMKKQHIRINEVTDSTKNTSFVFSGNLQQTSVMEAVQFLEIGQREGVLHVYCGRRKGYLTFIRGEIIDAFYRDNNGTEAVLQMFNIDEGDFYFEPKTIIQPRIINDTILDLAFEYDERKQQGTI